MVAETVNDRETATRLAERLMDSISRPVELDGLSAAVGVSIGIARIERGDTLESAVARADRATYASKQAGGGYAFGEPDGGPPDDPDR